VFLLAVMFTSLNQQISTPCRSGTERRSIRNQRGYRGATGDDRQAALDQPLSQGPGRWHHLLAEARESLAERLSEEPPPWPATTCSSGPPWLPRKHRFSRTERPSRRRW